MDVMAGRTLSEGWEEFKNKFWELYKASKPVRVKSAVADQCTYTQIIVHFSYHMLFILN